MACTAIGETINYYNTKPWHDRDWRVAVNEIIPDSSQDFKDALAIFLQNNQIDSGYRQYFYNYPKFSRIMTYQESQVYNIITSGTYIDGQFDSILGTAIKDNPKIILESYQNIKSRGSQLPDFVFENKALLQAAMKNESEMIEEYLENKINIIQPDSFLKMMEKIAEIQMDEQFHQKYSETICRILYYQLLQVEGPPEEYRKRFLLSVGNQIKHYKKLFVSDLPGITLPELSAITDVSIAIDLTNVDKADPTIIKELSQIVFQNKNNNISSQSFERILRRFEAILRATIGKFNRGFSNTFYFPILCEYMKTNQKINGNFEKVIISVIKANKQSPKKYAESLKIYVDLLNSLPTERLLNSSYKNIEALPIHNGLSEDICDNLLQRGSGLAYFANMKKTLEDIHFTGHIRKLFVSSAKEIFSKDRDLFISCRQRLCADVPKRGILEHAELFKKPYPIIHSAELRMISLIVGIQLIDSSLLSEDSLNDIVPVLCEEKRNAAETEAILNFICNIQSRLRGFGFNKLNFENLSYADLLDAQKNEFKSRLNETLSLKTPSGAINYMTKTRFLDESLERQILIKGNDDDLGSYNNLLQLFNVGTETTKKILAKDTGIRKRPGFALQIIYDQGRYDYYVASLRFSHESFIFEPDKLETLGDTYLMIFSGKVGDNETRKAMLESDDLIDYIYSLDRVYPTEKEYLLPFSAYKQTPRLLSTLASCSTEVVREYVNSQKKKLTFVEETYEGKSDKSENARKQFIEYGLANEEWLLNSDIKRTLINSCIEESEKEKINKLAKEIKRIRKRKNEVSALKIGTPKGSIPNDGI